MLITFANSWDLDQDRQNVGPDLDLTLWNYDSVPKEYFEKDLKKISRRQKSMKNSGVKPLFCHSQ